MDVVDIYLAFKRKWLIKLIYQVSDLYVVSNDTLKWEKNIDEFLEDCIDTYLAEEDINDEILNEYSEVIDPKILDKIDISLFKVVLNTYNKPKYIISNYSYLNLVFISIILESAIDLYRMSFDHFHKDDVSEILEINILGIDSIKYKKKTRKLNVIISYLEYLSKKNKETFDVLKDDRIDVHLVRLVSKMNYYLCDSEINLKELNEYDDDIVNEVKEDKNIDKRLIPITYQIARLKLLLTLELQKEKITKILYFIDNDNIDDEVTDKIKRLSKSKQLNKYFLFVSNDLEKLKGLSNIFDTALYHSKADKLTKLAQYENMTLVVKKSFWLNNKLDDKKFKNKNITFVTINDKVANRYERKEV